MRTEYTSEAEGPMSGHVEKVPFLPVSCTPKVLGEQHEVGYPWSTVHVRRVVRCKAGTITR